MNRDEGESVIVCFNMVDPISWTIILFVNPITNSHESGVCLIYHIFRANQFKHFFCILNIKVEVETNLIVNRSQEFHWNVSNDDHEQHLLPNNWMNWNVALNEPNTRTYTLAKSWHNEPNWPKLVYR